MRNNYHFWGQELSPEYCQKLISKCSQAPLHEGQIRNNNSQEQDISFRNNLISFTEDIEIKTLVTNYLIKANRVSFGFEVDYVPAVQFSRYEQGTYYNFHHDVNWFNTESMYDRKLSIIIQLSDENSYEGGDFVFCSSVHTPVTMRAQGSIIVFPSYINHRVTEITKGVRHSLVCWMEGPRWK